MLKDANTIDEAVGRYYEDPNKYSKSQGGGISNSPKNPEERGPPVYTPYSNTLSYAPSYTPSANATGGTVVRHHTNQVIEAGDIRALDEVSFIVSYLILVC